MLFSFRLYLHLYFADFCEQYDEKFASIYGMYPMERIQPIDKLFATYDEIPEKFPMLTPVITVLIVLPRVLWYNPMPLKKSL